MKEKKLKFIKGVFCLGGLSESGKTHAGKLLEKEKGVLRQKIIKIEEIMMKERGFDLSKGLTDECFQKLYENEDDTIFAEFLNIAIQIMKKENKSVISFESLYRPKLGLYLKKIFKSKCSIIYIDAPLDTRIEREYNKVKLTKENVSIDAIKNSVQAKDRFKISKNANKIKDIADFIVFNDSNLSLNEFEKEIIEIYKKTVNK